MSRRESVGGAFTRTQSRSEAPAMQFVKVAVLPPRLPSDVAPPTGIGAAEAFSWDESVNWKHNEKIDREGEISKPKGWMRKAGLTTQRKKANEDAPPFVFKDVPYDEWRKHYAKDKNGRYHGTLAPAEDCLLLPEDVEKWRLGEPETKADLWTRGKEVLPVYGQVQEENANTLPAYSERYDGPPLDELRLNSVASSSDGPDPARTSSFMASGKTREQIIQEAKDRHAQKDRKKSWKDSIKRGAEFAMMGH